MKGDKPSLVTLNDPGPGKDYKPSLNTANDAGPLSNLVPVDCLPVAETDCPPEDLGKDYKSSMNTANTTDPGKDFKPSMNTVGSSGPLSNLVPIDCLPDAAGQKPSPNTLNGVAPTLGAAAGG
jgi:hypothetical protein